MHSTDTETRQNRKNEILGEGEPFACRSKNILKLPCASSHLTDYIWEICKCSSAATIRNCQEGKRKHFLKSPHEIVLLSPLLNQLGDFIKISINKSEHLALHFQEEKPGCNWQP